MSCSRLVGWMIALDEMSQVGRAELAMLHAVGR